MLRRNVRLYKVIIYAKWMYLLDIHIIIDWKKYFIVFPLQAGILRRFVPLFDRVLVQKAEAITKTSSGILIPEKSQAKVLTGKVVAVGDGLRTEVSGKTVQVAVIIEHCVVGLVFATLPVIDLYFLTFSEFVPLNYCSVLLLWFSLCCNPMKIMYFLSEFFFS